MVLPLDMLRAGERAEIAEVHGDPALVGRLLDMGLQKGCPVCMVQPGSPCLLEVAGARICFRGAECSQILVRPLTES